MKGIALGQMDIAEAKERHPPRERQEALEVAARAQREHKQPDVFMSPEGQSF